MEISDPTIARLPIAAVERDTGLSKDVLRVWERRYGFPQPGRDANSERIYPAVQVEQLRMIRRLMDAGHRPGKLLAMSFEELAELDARRSASNISSTIPDSHLQVLTYLKAHDSQNLRLSLSQMLIKQGIHRFAIETIAGLNRIIGERWSTGDLRIYEEHLYTETVRAVMYSAITAMPRQQAEPKILLATFPNEPHSLGLLMADALLASEGATTISLGTELPIAEIADAAQAFGASIVCVSLSSAYGLKPAQYGLKDLRDALPSDTAIWVGGELSRRLRREAHGYVAMSELNELLGALRVWRAERFASTEAAAVVEELSANL